MCPRALSGRVDAVDDIGVTAVGTARGIIDVNAERRREGAVVVLQVFEARAPSAAGRAPAWRRSASATAGRLGWLDRRRAPCLLRHRDRSDRCADHEAGRRHQMPIDRDQGATLPLVLVT